MSRVRGGHNFSLLRFGNKPSMTHCSELNGIIALNSETVEFHKNDLLEDGFILCDENVESTDPRTIKMPMAQMAKDIGNPRVSGTIAVGAILKLSEKTFQAQRKY